MELFSDGEYDPMVDAKIYAMDNLAYDSAGYRLPFSLQLGLSAQYVDRNKQLLEDKNRKTMRLSQLITVTVIVWQTIEDYLFFESDETGWSELM
jgi:hypothetical protein